MDGQSHDDGICCAIHAISLLKMINSEINYIVFWVGVGKQHRIIKMALSHYIAII